MADQPYISVIVPLHNGATFIADTLSSLYQQTAGRIEVVVVDDGSTDDGAEIAARHPVRPRIVHQKQAGVAAARNRGCLVAQGEWLAFLDQDDLWHESRVERITPVLESASHGFVLTTIRSFSVDEDRPALRASGPYIEGFADAWVPAGAELERLVGKASPLDLKGSDERRLCTPNDLMSGTLSPTTSFFVHADHLRLIGGWSLHARSIDDWWLMANAALLEPILFLDQPTHLYRVHPGATSRRTNFWYPYASSLIALRFGANIEPLSSALERPLDNPTLRHLLSELLDSDEFRDHPGAASFTRHVSGILWPGAVPRRDFLTSRVRRAVPWLRPVWHRAKQVLRRAPTVQT